MSKAIPYGGSEPMYTQMPDIYIHIIFAKTVTHGPRTMARRGVMRLGGEINLGNQLPAVKRFITWLESVICIVQLHG